ncbi:MAG: nucleotidyltransferase family protein, partial [Candidatus Thorarchaeota archaeon]
RAESDLDILIEFSCPVSLLHIVIVENYLTDLLGIPVDVVLERSLRKELKSAILKEIVPI